MQHLTDWIHNLVQGEEFFAYVIAAVVVAVTALVVQLVSRVMRRLLSSDGIPLPSSSILINIIRVAIWAVGLSVMLSACFGVDVNGLIAALGVGGVALTLGMQDTLKNFIGGLQVTVMKIVQPGDHIIVGGTEGIVHDVSWRQTVVKDYENITHLIPNSVINSTEVAKVEPAFLVSSVVVLNNDGRDTDGMLHHMEQLAKQAVQDVATLEKDPWLLVTQIGEYGIWAKLRFVLSDVEHAREARDAALRAIAPYTRNNADDVMPENKA